MAPCHTAPMGRQKSSLSACSTFWRRWVGSGQTVQRKRMVTSWKPRIIHEIYVLHSCNDSISKLKETGHFQAWRCYRCACLFGAWWHGVRTVILMRQFKTCQHAMHCKCPKSCWKRLWSKVGKIKLRNCRAKHRPFLGNSQFLPPFQSFWISALSASLFWGWSLDLAHGNSLVTKTFTGSYGKKGYDVEGLSMAGPVLLDAPGPRVVSRSRFTCPKREEWKHIRYFAPKEVANLMGFPDDWSLPGETLKMLGQPDWLHTLMIFDDCLYNLTKLWGIWYRLTCTAQYHIYNACTTVYTYIYIYISSTVYFNELRCSCLQREAIWSAARSGAWWAILWMLRWWPALWDVCWDGSTKDDLL